jgi:hypothetical protein
MGVVLRSYLAGHRDGAEALRLRLDAAEHDAQRLEHRPQFVDDALREGRRVPHLDKRCRDVGQRLSHPAVGLIASGLRRIIHSKSLSAV